MVVLALDIGGTKFAAGRVGDDGSVTGIETVPTPPSEVWAACAGLLSKVAAGEPVSRIGIGAAGPVYTARGITAPLNIPEWYHGFDVVTAVGKLFPQADIRFELDGACIALAEHLYGAGRGTPDLMGMVVSTGVGGGIVRGGQPTTGRTGNAGHIGHFVVPDSTDPCACGGVGCLEAVASGPSTVRWARANGWNGDTGVDLWAAALSGDEIAIAALRRTGTALGVAISSAAALLDLELVVIGGGFAQQSPLLWEPLQEAIGRHARLPYLSGLRVVPGELGSNGTLIGAAALTYHH